MNTSVFKVMEIMLGLHALVYCPTSFLTCQKEDIM